MTVHDNRKFSTVSKMIIFVMVAAEKNHSLKSSTELSLGKPMAFCSRDFLIIRNMIWKEQMLAFPKGVID